jgi:ABC-type uncharacterized transport system substrate-binding protein
MDRRAFVTGLGAVLATSIAVEAQPAVKVWRIGIIEASSGFSPANAFRQGLSGLGYVEGRNVIIEQRSADGRAERFPELIAEMLRLKVDVLVVGSTDGALAAKRATTTAPIVFAGVPDPVAQGIVASLAHPGGNITGSSLGIGEGFARKYVEFLKEALPNVSHLAAIWNSSSPAAPTFVEEMQVAARAFNARLDLVDVRSVAELDGAFAKIAASNAGGLIVVAHPLFGLHATRFVQFAATRRLPAMYFFSDFVRLGGLMAYGPSLADSFRLAAGYVDKILKGAKPADLPVELSTKFELVINLKTAKALGLTIPQSLLLRADQVIE